MKAQRRKARGRRGLARGAATPARSQRDATEGARPRRLRVHYERAGRSFYSAAVAGGAKMTSTRSRVEAEVTKADAVPLKVWTEASVVAPA